MGVGPAADSMGWLCFIFCIPLSKWVAHLTLSRFSHGIGVRYRPGVLRANDLWAVRGLGMTTILNDFLLFSCLVMFVWGAVIAAVTLLI